MEFILSALIALVFVLITVQKKDVINTKAFAFMVSSFMTLVGVNAVFAILRLYYKII